MSPAAGSLPETCMDDRQNTLLHMPQQRSWDLDVVVSGRHICRKISTDVCCACRLIQPMLDELKALTAARAGHNAAMNVGAGVLGSRILQILEVTSAVVIPPPPKKSIFSRAVSPRSLARRPSRAFAWPTAY